MDDHQKSELVRVPAKGGDAFAIAGASLVWKVRSGQAEGKFCLFEQTLHTGDGVPLHTHSYPEAFYILSGTIDFSSGGSEEGVRCGPGDVVIARPHTRHSFFNCGKDTARLLSISVAAHEQFFDAVAAADKAEPFADLSPADAMVRVAAIGARTDTNFSGADGADVDPEHEAG